MSRAIQSENVDASPTERTPLIPAGPSSTDASIEARIEHEPNGTVESSANGKTSDDTPANQTISLLRGVLTALALGCLIFLQATNISLLTTTQSSIASELDAFDTASWFTSSYLIAMSALGPLNGKLSAVFSPRNTIVINSMLLAVGAIICGLARTFEGFITGRVFQGMGASGVFTVSIIIVLELTPATRRGLAVGLVNSGYTIGVALGATAAGALLPHVGWRALFLGQAPIAVLAGLVLLLSIPNTFTAGKKDETQMSAWKRVSRLDYLGFVTLTTSIVLLLYSLGSPKDIPVLPLILSGLVFVSFILNEVYIAADPAIPITLLKSRGLLFTCLGTVGYMMARWAVLFYSPTYAIAVRQWSPATAGAILIPTNGGFAIGGLLVGWLHIRHHGSFYFPTLIVYAIFPCTLVLLSALATQDSSIWLFVIDILICGAATGAALNYNLAHVLHLTPKSTHYITTSLVATFRGFSGSFGSAIGSGLFTRTLNRSLSEQFARHDLQRDALVRRLLGSPALVGTLDDIEREIAVRGYEEALRTLFLAGAGLAALTVFLQAATGQKGAGEEKVIEEETEALSDDRREV